MLKNHKPKDFNEILNDKNSIIALVGATNSKRKYGNIIFKDLLRKKYNAYPVNPRATTVEGHKAYKNLKELLDETGKIDLINIVIPPKLALAVIEEAESLSLNNLWFQPGAESGEIIDKCKASNLNFLVHSCIML